MWRQAGQRSPGAVRMPEEPAPRSAPAAELPGWLRGTMRAAGLGLILVAAPLAHFFSTVEGGGPLLLAVGATAFLFASLDRLESFSAWGLSAKLREAEKAAQQAAASAAEVRALALSVVRLALEQAHAGGRMDGNRRAKLLVDREAARLLDALGASPAERRAVFQEVNVVVLHDMARAVHRATMNAAKPEDKTAVQEQIRRGEDGWVLGKPAPSSESLRALAEEFGAVDHAVEAALRHLADAEERARRGEVLASVIP